MNGGTSDWSGRCNGLEKRRFLLRCRSWFWRRDNWSRWRCYESGSIRCWSLQRDVLQSLARSEITVARAAASATRGSSSTSTNSGLGFEIISCCGIDDQQQNERMSKKRGSGALPPPLSLARYADRRPIRSLYVDGCSFGDTPITFTPAPRATSIAKITSEYLTFGSPFTKMTFSGRPS